ncbi:hypothetical protein Tco_1131860 [Tanacetum coccineum]|uniref:Uncharacterized protein n=1 Tax=Tanacetum coccineum TaxID=301880 RepID=A0ABQ5JEE6_9ASTR
MTSLEHRLNPPSSASLVKECMTCGALYTADFCCSKGSLEDKILVPKPLQNCATCGNPVDGLYCRHCVFVRKCLNEGWYTIHDENEILNTSKSSKNNTNVVSAPQEPFVFNQDPGENSSQSPLQINHNCCYKCGDLLDDENSFTYDSKPNSFNDSPNILTHPPQLQFETYLYEICGNNAHYGYDCPPQFPLFPVNYPPQKTSREILQAQEDLMEAIQAFLKEYDHIPPNKKFMALLLAEERFLKIKQTMEEEKSTRKEGDGNSKFNSMIDDEEARDNFLKDVYTFLRKSLMDKQYRQEDIQELMRKLLEDVRNISEEFSEYINCPSWNRPLFYFNDDDDEYTVIWRRPKAITPVLSTKEPVDSLIMGDEHLDTIPEKESDELIKSSVENRRVQAILDPELICPWGKKIKRR